jgi:tripartite ATP-independent transporter DctM subunit
MSDLLRPRPTNPVFKWLNRFEEWVSVFALAVLLLLPISDFIARQFFHSPIPGSLVTSRNLLLYITFFGGMLAAREGQHLAIGTFVAMAGHKLKNVFDTAAAFLAVSLSAAFTWGATSLFLTGFDPAAKVGSLPLTFFTLAMPVGLGFITLRFASRAPISTKEKWFAATGVLFGTVLAFHPAMNVWAALLGAPDWMDAAVETWNAALSPFTGPAIVILIAMAFAGTPLFIVLGGIAWFLFIPTGGALETIANEGFTLLTDGSMPAIPLFTLVGFILAEGKAAQRLIRMFKAWFGWLPGGLVFVVVLVSAFFTTFTGASGVTILALGMILYLILTKSGYSSLFAVGLLAASGSIGLLLPPSLPIILYAGKASTSVIDLFLGGLIPGLLMIVAMTVMGVFASFKTKVERPSFELREALVSARDALLDVMLPVLIVVVYFSGWMDLTETASLSAVYAIVVNVFILRDLTFKNLFRAMTKALVILGGILMILALARGLSYYIVDVQIPEMLAKWVTANVSSPLVFLIFLNLALLVVGMFMDIYSALLVVVPLILPLGVAYGIEPVHLGIIFLVNMEIGFLTPPVGLNLYLATYVFKQPLTKITGAVLPFLGVQLLILALVTYVPWFSMALVNWAHGAP